MRKTTDSLRDSPYPCHVLYTVLICGSRESVSRWNIFPYLQRKQPPSLQVRQPRSVTSARSSQAGQRLGMETKSAPGPSGLENLNKWDPSAQQAFIQPATHNKNSIRVAAILAASALAAKGSLLVPGNLAKVLNC